MSAGSTHGKQMMGNDLDNLLDEIAQKPEEIIKAALEIARNMDESPAQAA